MRGRNPWLMTDERLGDALLPILRRLPLGSGVVFRHRDTPRAERQALFRKVARIAGARRLLLVSVGGLGGTPAHGGPRPFTAPAHSRAEALRQVRRGARVLFVSPVCATRSHPGAIPLGPMQAARVAQGLGVQVIALGGMDARRWRRISQLGFDGWAAIDALAQSGQKWKAVPR